MSRQRVITGCKVHCQDDIETCKRACSKVQPQSLSGNALKQRIALTVKDARNLICSQQYRYIDSGG